MHPRIHFARAIPGISSITYGQLIDIQAYYCHLKIVSLTTLHKPMPRATSISRLAAMLIAASGFFAGSANAAEYLALNSPVYKLSLDGGDASAAKVPAAVVPEPLGQRPDAAGEGGARSRAGSGAGARGDFG